MSERTPGELTIGEGAWASRSTAQLLVEAGDLIARLIADREKTKETVMGLTNSLEQIRGEYEALVAKFDDFESFEADQIRQTVKAQESLAAANMEIARLKSELVVPELTKGAAVEISEVNARISSAAPDLLDSAEALIYRYDNPDRKPYPALRTFGGLIEDLRTAIAKAKG
jgi:hypothetical protein